MFQNNEILLAFSCIFLDICIYAELFMNLIQLFKCHVTNLNVYSKKDNNNNNFMFDCNTSDKTCQPDARTENPTTTDNSETSDLLNPVPFCPHGDMPCASPDYTTHMNSYHKQLFLCTCTKFIHVSVTDAEDYIRLMELQVGKVNSFTKEKADDVE